ncbi:hypothetical protein M409DRAFT_20674 [Zasmidium cellare ATCC 36951]|uniref:VOC domain-containing protein n=1 Tax=Zasmidium cellare ATCC 36951 TaxID=1080233 RepID=A0A6A6CVC4_ZASCE|nr:uncharacterized protein M409DRAFT_20674 [Zasmidium cellare ATCC 36951]KAF2169456.1 hypothetical protein M409DRAFT_20674 [Zasmidium cellare ATCC 36951]
MSLAKAHIRIARPTNDLEPIKKFYCEGLGLKVLYEFYDHEGFDGIMLGSSTAPYHFEFTRKAGHDAGRAPSDDNLTVFYLPDEAEWKAAVDRMTTAGHASVKAFNPYWDRCGRTFEDADGYRIVLCKMDWKNPDV